MRVLKNDDHSSFYSLANDRLDETVDDLGLPEAADQRETRKDGDVGSRFPFPEIAGYEIQQEIGVGGTSRVYLASRATSNDQFAIKVFSGTVFDRDSLIRFSRELESLKKLRHPNIVKLVDFGVAQNVSPYLVLDYINGQNVGDYCKGESLSEQQIAQLMISVCRAVDQANQVGILHRDLKPSNILVEQSGNPFVTDFGLAKILADGELHQFNSIDKTRTGAILGTLNYLSPEQMFGRHAQVGPATDVFGIGTVLYSLLTHEAPFDFDDVVEAAKCYFQKLPTRLPPSVPDSLAQICLTCLSADPKDRYQSAGDVAKQLERSVNGKPVLVPQKRISSWAIGLTRKYPWLGTAVAITTTALLVSSVFFLYQWQATTHSLAQAEAQADGMKEALIDFADLVREQEDNPATIKIRRDQLRLISQHFERLELEFKSDSQFLMESATTDFKLGRLEHYLGHHDLEKTAYRNALRGFQKLVALDPKHEAGRFGVFHSQLSLGDLPSAYMAIEELCAAFPDEPKYQEAAISVALQITSRELQHEGGAPDVWIQKVGQLISRQKAENPNPQHFRHVAEFKKLAARMTIQQGALEEAQTMLSESAAAQLNVRPLESKVDSESSEYLKILHLGFSVAATRGDVETAKDLEHKFNQYFELAKARYPGFVEIYWSKFNLLRDAAAFYRDIGSDVDLQRVTNSWSNLLGAWPTESLDGEEFNIAAVSLYSDPTLSFFNRNLAQRSLGRLNLEHYAGVVIPALMHLGEKNVARELRSAVASSYSGHLKESFLAWLDEREFDLSKEGEHSILATSSAYFFVSQARKLAAKFTVDQIDEFH